MSAIRQANSKSLMLFSGRAYPELAGEIAGHLGVAPTPTASYEFANGELFVRFEESVRGCDAFVVQSHTAPINPGLMEQLIMVDALKRASAFSAASAAGEPGRRRRTQPATFRWTARATAMAPGGTSLVITEPAAVYAPSPTVTGATSMVSEPIRTWSPIVVRCLATPS